VLQRYCNTDTNTWWDLIAIYEADTIVNMYFEDTGVPCWVPPGPEPAPGFPSGKPIPNPLPDPIWNPQPGPGLPVPILWLACATPSELR
jgi:hypothetical protein